MKVLYQMIVVVLIYSINIIASAHPNPSSSNETFSQQTYSAGPLDIDGMTRQSNHPTFDKNSVFDPLGGETPASLACIYGLTTRTSRNCNPHEVTAISRGGQGATVIIMAAYHNKDISGDLAKFSKAYNLPPTNLKTIHFGKQPNFKWNFVEDLAVETVHAMAPYAKIVLVEAKNTSINSMKHAFNYVLNLAEKNNHRSVVLFSGDAPKIAARPLEKIIKNHPNITIVDGTGSTGMQSGYPAALNSVISVGGTTIHRKKNNVYQTAWSFGHQTDGLAFGGSGGYVKDESEPNYQKQISSISRLTHGHKGTPDISADANPKTGLSAYILTVWFKVGGTKLSEDIIAGLIASHYGNYNRFNIHRSLYSPNNPYITDIKHGHNGLHEKCRKGYDLVTGLGTVNSPEAFFVHPPFGS